MDEQYILLRVVDVLEQLEIPYMLTGSLAVSYYGVPRATHDIDIVVVLSVEQGRKIPATFGSDFYTSDIERAIQHRQMFNLIHQATQMKIDFWLLDKNNVYRKNAFDRRVQIDLWGKVLFLISGEDLVISKLLWFTEAQTEVHINDVRGILKSQGNLLNSQYIERWCEQLSMTKLWSELKKEIQ